MFEVMPADWDEYFPDVDMPGLQVEEDTEVWSGNITHNLGQMAKAAGLYTSLWRPEEEGYVLAKDIVENLRLGLESLLEFPEEYKTLNPSNGWGTYEGFRDFVAEYLAACREYPQAQVRVSR